jgi:hypothetical protein
MSPRDQNNRNRVNDQRTDWLEEMYTRSGLQKESRISRDSENRHRKADTDRGE